MPVKHKRLGTHYEYCLPVSESGCFSESSISFSLRKRRPKICMLAIQFTHVLWYILNPFTVWPLLHLQLPWAIVKELLDQKSKQGIPTKNAAKNAWYVIHNVDWQSTLFCPLCELILLLFLLIFVCSLNKILLFCLPMQWDPRGTLTSHREDLFCPLPLGRNQTATKLTLWSI